VSVHSPARGARARVVVRRLRGLAGGSRPRNGVRSSPSASTLMEVAGAAAPDVASDSCTAELVEFLQRSIHDAPKTQSGRQRQFSTSLMWGVKGVAKSKPAGSDVCPARASTLRLAASASS
jgi:hypothetical protein